jgi:TolB-like protein/DNA-binding winged helix-turn-helix (wHTH) protein/Flp pilus assembly protein TadD
VSEVAPSLGVVRFGAFEVDLRKGEVRKHNFRLRLQDQPFRILQILLEHPGELVTREEIQRRIWPADTFVDFEKGLNNAIRKLRDALGDSAEEPRFIETHSGRGYSFIGAVTATNGASQKGKAVSPVEVSVPAPSRSLYRRLAVGAVVLLAFVATLFGFDVGGVREHWLTRASSPVIHSLAVLPLQNLSNDPDQEYFSDGMTDALITDLAQIASVRVISRTSSMQYKQTKKSLPEIARELNVDGIVEGTVQRSVNRVRITAQLISGPSDKHLWANSYERDTRDVFAIQRDIADDIRRQIQARFVVANQLVGAHLGPIDPKVLDAYVQGNYHLNGRGHGGGDEEQRKAQAYFEQAIAADPNFALAHVGLAYAHAILSQPSSDDLVLMRKAAEKAIALDSSSSEGWVALGLSSWQNWDWARAEQEFRRAIALNPNNAQAHANLGSVLDVIGRSEEAWKEFLIAQELDPNQDHLADPLYQRGQFDRAIEIRQRIAKRDHEDGYNHYALGLIYAQKGMYREFVAEMSRTAALFELPELGEGLQRAYDLSGQQGVLKQLAENMEHLAATKQLYMPGATAQFYAALGDKNRAFYCLGEYFKHRDLALTDPTIDFKTDPWFAPLRSDPRFSDFLRRVGLPP